MGKARGPPCEGASAVNSCQWHLCTFVYLKGVKVLSGDILVPDPSHISKGMFPYR